jgi:hypothetical protein
MGNGASDRIRGIVGGQREALRRMTEAQATAPRAPGKWSRKEILGHLVDSAANNHQRFVRTLLADSLEFPGYIQAEWVRSQGYGEERWEQLVDLWAALNLHLAHLVDRIPAGKMSTPCRIGDRPPVTLEALIADYLRHLEHHLEQLPV